MILALVLIVIVFFLLCVWSCCVVAGRADDAAERAARLRAERAKRRWMERESK